MGLYINANGIIFFHIGVRIFFKLKNRTISNIFYDIIRLILRNNFIYIIFTYFIINNNHISFNFKIRDILWRKYEL